MTFSLVKRNDYHSVPLSKIDIEDGFNVRKDLGDIESLEASIVVHGVKQAVTGHKIKVDGLERWVLTDGHRRYFAAKSAFDKGLLKEEPKFKWILEERGYTEENRIIDLIIMNSGKDLTTIEKGDVYCRLISKGWSQTKIAKETGMSTAHVSMCISLVEDGGEEIKKAVKEKTISPSTAGEIIRNSQDEKAQEKILTDVTEKAKNIGRPESELKSSEEGNMPVITRKFLQNHLKEEKNEVTGMEAIMKLIEEANSHMKDGGDIDESKLELVKDVFRFASGKLSLAEIIISFA